MSELKVRLRVKLILGDYWWGLEEDTTLPRSVAWGDSKIQLRFRYCRKTPFCLLFMIYDRERWKETQRGGLFLLTNNSPFTQMKHILCIPGWGRWLRYPFPEEKYKTRIFGAVSNLGGERNCVNRTKDQEQRNYQQTELSASRGAEDRQRRKVPLGTTPLADHTQNTHLFEVLTLLFGEEGEERRRLQGYKQHYFFILKVQKVSFQAQMLFCCKKTTQMRPFIGKLTKC